jgi:hypothetical protein
MGLAESEITMPDGWLAPPGEAERAEVAVHFYIFKVPRRLSSAVSANPADLDYR